MSQTAQHYRATIQVSADLDYYLYLPPGYEDGDAPWPLLLFLHGAGERGDDLSMLLRHPLPGTLAVGQDIPFVVVSPQCPQGSWWTEQSDALISLLQHIQATERIDASRIYLTGLSMGGYGAWLLAMWNPEFFAAVAPICGGYRGPASDAALLGETPVWAFHGAMDPVVPPEMSQSLVDALKSAGGDARLTLYPDLEHDSWTVTYANPDLYEWLLSHQRG